MCEYHILANMSNYEECRGNLEKFVVWYSQHESQRNEAATRLQLINRLFFECLGWSPGDVHPEESQDGVYSDYTFLAPRRILIVEAKKEGDYFELPAGAARLEYPILSLFRDYENLKQAIQQVAKYCQSRGVPLACVSNGHQVVVFIATRNDGLSPFDGKALVFATPEFMQSHFLELWQALSKPGVEEKKIFPTLLGQIVPPLPPRLADSLSIYPGVKGRNSLQADLQIVSDLVIEDVIRSVELETIFLNECYCESGALSQHSLMAKNILEARYASLFEPEQPGPTIIPVTDKAGINPELVAESLSRRPIILLGDVGVGKTSFLRRLIKIEAVNIIDNAIILYIDLGSKATLTTKLSEFIPSEIQRQLSDDYKIDIEEAKFVRGVYNLELKRFAKSLYGEMQGNDPESYKKSELSFLLAKVQDKNEHLRQSLNHIAKARKKQIIVFLDNADQRDETIQQQAFLIAEELAKHWNATVFVSLRPETFHRSLSLGALSGYHPKAFSISPPRVDKVIEKRLKFALKLTSGEISLQTYGSHVRLNLASLDHIIRHFLLSLENKPELQEFIENISAGNVRVALGLIEQFFGSGHVDANKILKKITTTGGYSFPLHELLRAIIYGDAQHYDPTTSPIANLFDISHPDPKEHFILPLMLSTLSAIGTAHATDGFVEIEELYEPLQFEGFTPEQIDLVIIRAQRKRLIETSTRLMPSPPERMPKAMRTTSVGLYHVSRLCRFFAYIDAIIVDTPIFPSKAGFNPHDEIDISQRTNRAEAFRQYLDEQWQSLAGPKRFFDWTKISSELMTDINLARYKAGQRRNYLF
jgi:hypothetical protein